MTVKITKPSINVREKLSELDKETGIKGEELLRADTSAEAREALQLDEQLFTDFESTGIDDNATSTKLTVSDSGINVTGTATATAFVGDGSGLTGVSGGALELISTTTVSGTPSTIDVTSGFSSTYDDYVIYAADLAGSATAVIRIQVYTGGTLEAGANYSYVRNNQGSTWTVETSKEYIEASVLSTNTGGFKAEIFDSNNTVANNSFLCAYGRNRTALSGQWNSSGAVTGFRLLLSTGTFVSGGTIRLYGIKKS